MSDEGGNSGVERVLSTALVMVKVRAEVIEGDKMVEDVQPVLSHALTVEHT